MSSSDELVFIVDDDEASSLSMQALLQAHAFRVVSFPTAESFLQAFQTPMRGCLVLDLRLPGMSGLELQQELRRRGHRLPIVMISGHADGQSHRQALENGAQAFLQKPFAGGALCTEVQKALESTL